jgi:hypothetical protein
MDIQSLPPGGLVPLPSEKWQSGLINKDWAFGETIEGILERDRKRSFVFIIHCFLTLHPDPVALLSKKVWKKKKKRAETKFQF